MSREQHEKVQALLRSKEEASSKEERRAYSAELDAFHGRHTDHTLEIAQRLDMTAAQEDLGYEPEYGLEAGFRNYINVLREEHGLDPV